MAPNPLCTISNAKRGGISSDRVGAIERAALGVLGLLLLHAGAVADAIGLAILVSVFLLQIRGQRSGKKGWDVGSKATFPVVN